MLMKRFIISCMLICLFATADVLTVRSGKREGVFLGYKGLKVSFQEWNSVSPMKFDMVNVLALELEEPVKGKVYTTRDTKRGVDCIVNGFKNGSFIATISGVERYLSMRQIYQIECLIDMDAVKKKHEAHIEKEEASQQFSSVVELLRPGRVTIVHFYQAGDERSVKLGVFAQDLCEKSSKIKAAYRKVVISGADDEMAKKFRLEKLPQMWFFGEKEARIVSLGEKAFAEDEIRRAFDQAVQGR